MEPISPYKPPSSGIRVGGTEISFKQVIVALLLSFCVAHSGYALYGDYMHPTERASGPITVIKESSSNYVQTQAQYDRWLDIQDKLANAKVTNANANYYRAEHGITTTNVSTTIPAACQGSVAEGFTKAVNGTMEQENFTKLVASFPSPKGS